MIIKKWKHIENKVIGKRHSGNGEVCQDYTYSTFKNGVFVMALADGAGSKKMSQFGAEVVTKGICDLMSIHFSHFLMLCEKRGVEPSLYQSNQKILKKIIIDSLMTSLISEARKLNVPVDELSSTLLFFAHHKDFYIQGHIGDGIIGGIYEDDLHHEVALLSAPENGAQSNITFFVPDFDALDHLRISSGYRPNLKGVLLMSDGPGELFYQTKQGFNENTIKLFDNFKYKSTSQYTQIIDTFLKDTVSQFSDDDLSISLYYKETLSTNDNVPGFYIPLFFQDVYSKSQLIPISKFAYIVVPYLPSMTRDFVSVDDVRRYLGWS